MWRYASISLVGSSLSAAPRYIAELTTAADDEEVVSVEERCSRLEGEVSMGGRHSYLVVTTASGRKARLDYFAGGQIIFEEENYTELSPQELFRRGKARPGVTLRDVKREFQSAAWSQNYSLWSHNCQHVVLSTYNSVTGLKESVLRNDYLVAFLNYIPAYMRKQFLSSSPEKVAQKEIRKHISAEDGDEDEYKWRFLKSARINFAARVMRLAPGLTAQNLPQLPNEKPATNAHNIDYWVLFSAYDKELLAWEKSKVGE